jgi:hypothetical protein
MKFTPINIVVLTAIVITLPLFAKELVIPAEMTCADFLKYESSEQEDIVYAIKEKLAGDQIINIKEINIETIDDKAIDDKVQLTHIDDEENNKIIEICKNDKQASLLFKLKLYWEKKDS